MEMTAGAGYRLTRGNSNATSVLFFDPDTRTSYLLNTFVQDEVSVVPNRVFLTVGSKFEDNDFTGFEFQPTARVRWSPNSRQTVWAAVSRAVRMPTRFDTDLRFTGGSPVVELEGTPDFTSERVIATEAGYRARVAKVLSLDVAAFTNAYDHLRTEEPSAAPGGIPIMLENNMNATTRGVELGVDYQALPRLQLHGAYTRLFERFTLDPGNHDVSDGTAEHNDPENQFSLRSYLDLPRTGELDAVFRIVGALPAPATSPDTWAAVPLPPRAGLPRSPPCGRAQCTARRVLKARRPPWDRSRNAPTRASP